MANLHSGRERHVERICDGADGRYTIRLGRQRGAWAARAFRGTAAITPVLTGADRAAAVAQVRDVLSEMRAERRAARGDGTPIWTATLATWATEGDLIGGQELASLLRHADEPHFEWLMRLQVRDAVAEL